eukprot:1922448-Rhodomonas_salina.1
MSGEERPRARKRTVEERLVRAVRVRAARREHCSRVAGRGSKWTEEQKKMHYNTTESEEEVNGEVNVVGERRISGDSQRERRWSKISRASARSSIAVASSAPVSNCCRLSCSSN